MHPTDAVDRPGNAASRHRRFLDANSYVVYYGGGCAGQLKLFDIAILEPAAWDRESILDLKVSGLIALAYLSLLETQPGESPAGLEPRDFLMSQAPVPQALAQSQACRIIDPRSQTCTCRASSLVANAMRMGFDGLFVDTVSDVERPGLCDAGGAAAPGDELALAVAQQVGALRHRWPSAVICQNMGLETIRHLTCGIVDGFCWENFNRSIRNAWFWATLEWLARAGSKKKVFLLGEESEPGRTSQSDIEMARTGHTRGFLTYLAPRGYCSGVNSGWLINCSVEA